MPNKTKDTRIKAEHKRLSQLYKDLPKDTQVMLDGLIRRAAYMRVTLEDYEEDLDTGGYVEMFSQSEKTDPYERERPVARLYNSMNTNYQKIVRQLSDALPDSKSIDPAGELAEFIAKGRK